MIKLQKPNLVISAVGDQSLHKQWMPKDEDNFDLALIYYGDEGEKYKEDAKFYIKQKGPKYHLITQAIDQNPEILNYKYIWMPDDDIALPRDEIQRLFSISKRNHIWISQPSIMGWYGLDVTLHHKNSFLRFTNYVEIMCPCFEQQALKKCMITFKENKTGWGIDHVWNQLLGHPTNKIAIIDDVIAIHTRPIGGGDTYKNQASGSMKIAQEEGEQIYEKYKMNESSYDDLKNGKLISTESFGLFYHNTVEYSKIYKQLEAGVDVSERLWPPSPMVKKLCENLRE